MDNTILAELISTIKNLSPMVWEILMKQVYANAATRLLWGLVMAVGAPIFLIKFIPYASKQCKKEGWASNWDMAQIFAWIFGIIVSIVGFIILTGALQALYNPEYYAIENLLNSLH